MYRPRKCIRRGTGREGKKGAKDGPKAEGNRSTHLGRNRRQTEVTSSVPGSRNNTIWTWLKVGVEIQLKCGPVWKEDRSNL